MAARLKAGLPKAWIYTNECSEMASWPALAADGSGGVPAGLDAISVDFYDEHNTDGKAEVDKNKEFYHKTIYPRLHDHQQALLRRRGEARAQLRQEHLKLRHQMRVLVPQTLHHLLGAVKRNRRLAGGLRGGVRGGFVLASAAVQVRGPRNVLPVLRVVRGVSGVRGILGTFLLVRGVGSRSWRLVSGWRSRG